MLEPLCDQTHAIVEHEDAGRVGQLARHVDQHRIAAQQGRCHAVPFHMHDPELRGAGLQFLADPRLAEVVGTAGRIAILGHHRAAAHGGARRGMGNRHEGIVRVLDEGGRALDLADAVDQPVAVNLQPGTILGKITASGKYAAHDPAASNGTQTAAAILWDSVDASGGDKNAVVLIRGPAIVNQYEITIPGTPTAPQIAAAHAALLTLGILVR